jgi:hypothetical protein
VPFSCHSSPPLREPSELGDERRELSPRSHCQPSAGTPVNDQPELWKASGEPERQASPGATTTGGGSPGNRTLNLRIKSLIKSVFCTCGFGPKLCFSQAQPIASENSWADEWVEDHLAEQGVSPRIAFNLIAKDDRVGVWIMRADGSRRRQRSFGKYDAFPDWRPHAGSQRLSPNRRPMVGQKERVAPALGSDTTSLRRRRRVHASVNRSTASSMSSGSALAAARSPRVAKRLTDSPPLAVFGADLPTNTNPIGRVRKTQDLRQRFSGQLFVWETLTRQESRKCRSKAHLAEGVGLEPTSPCGQRFSRPSACQLA